MQQDTPKPGEQSLPDGGGEFALQIAGGGGSVAERVGQSGVASQKPQQRESGLIGKDVFPFLFGLRTFVVESDNDVRHDKRILMVKKKNVKYEIDETDQQCFLRFCLFCRYGVIIFINWDTPI